MITIAMILITGPASSPALVFSFQDLTQQVGRGARKMPEINLVMMIVKMAMVTKTKTKLVTKTKKTTTWNKSVTPAPEAAEVAK